jgi:osmotically-inducible protein OsmY
MSKIFNPIRLALYAFALFVVLSTQAPGSAQEPGNNNAPDNSSRNKVHNTTADQQKENDSDRENARKIRQSVTADRSLSTYAHNVKIIAQGGNVTLKGPVRSPEEKQSVAAKAAEVVGKANVTDELTVKSSEPSDSQRKEDSNGR